MNQDDLAQRRRRGRPSRGPTKSTEVVEFRATVDELAQLTTVARENGLPMATVVREAVNCFVADYRDGIVFIKTR